ncbi:hypothetical protein ZIOFF_013169 [Zingiber officinale]|uniref:LOB domain-containing protein n=1 Tax=Zingiber officinale TaxID=94328 RepID=A0A8J5HBB1_ZINOF|nr:hypothetical protein ZIOFF_013169 [Zingiber officinale]
MALLYFAPPKFHPNYRMIARRRRIYIMVMSKERRKKSNSSSIASPCAACKLLRRRCAQDCIFAPHFPAEEPHKFANVHRVFGASNISKLLQEVTVGQRGDAVSSLVYEANARLRDPVYGCVAAISSLHRQIQALQAQLAMAQAQVVHLRLGHAACCLALRQRPTTAPAGSSAGTEDKAASQVVALDMVVVEESNLGDQPPIWFVERGSIRPLQSNRTTGEDRIASPALGFLYREPRRRFHHLAESAAQELLLELWIKEEEELVARRVAVREFRVCSVRRREIAGIFCTLFVFHSLLLFLFLILFLFLYHAAARAILCLVGSHQYVLCH